MQPAAQHHPSAVADVLSGMHHHSLAQAVLQVASARLLHLAPEVELPHIAMPGLLVPLVAIISQQPTKSQGMEEDAAWALADLQYPVVAVLVPLWAAVPATVDGWIADRRMPMRAVPTKIAATL